MYENSSVLFTDVYTLLYNVINAQSVFSINRKSKLYVKIFVVKSEGQAYLKIFNLNSSSKANRNNGKWFFTKYENQVKFNIYFVDLANQSDVKFSLLNIKAKLDGETKVKSIIFIHR
ncbi:DUF6150 family protein [Empedobacter brevis]